MSNIDNILNKIIEDSEDKARDIVREAEEKGKGLVAEKEQLAENLAKSITDKAEEDAPQIVDKLVTSAQLSSRDKVLKEKVRIIDDIIERAKDTLSNIDEDTYVKFVRKSVERMNLREGSEIILPENRKFSIVKANLGLTISRDSVENGFSVRSGDVFYNNTFDAIIESRRDELERVIADKLSYRG